MPHQKFAAVFLSLLMLAACGKNSEAPQTDKTNEPAAASGATEVIGLMTPVAFADITDDEERAVKLFDEMAKVMLHPRCANCHPKEGGPTQGDDMKPHEPPVVRGDGMGVVGMECSACHGPANVEFASMEGSIPGAEPWLLAPVSMGWSESSPAALCAQIKNPDLNGGKTLQELVDHNGRDHLVNWAWHPGEGRTPAPGDQATLGALTAAWVEAGAHCPQG